MADDLGDAGLTRKVPRQGPQCPRCGRPNAEPEDHRHAYRCWLCRHQFEVPPDPAPQTAAPEVDEDDLTPHWLAFGAEGWGDL